MSNIFYLRKKDLEQNTSLDAEVFKSSVSIFIVSLVIALLPILGLVTLYEINTTDNLVYELDPVEIDSQITIVKHNLK